MPVRSVRPQPASAAASASTHPRESIIHTTVPCPGGIMAAKGMQQIRLTAVLVAALAFLGSCAHHRARVGPASADLPAPALVSPRDQAVLTNHPRTIRFAWSRVPQAAAYGIEIDCLGCCAHGQWCSDVPGKA